jgi:fatty acid desaturase
MSHNDYATLKQRVVTAGLLDKQPRAALTAILVNFALLLLCIAIFAWFRNLWIVALNAVFLSFISGQFGFVMHEAGHRQMFRQPWLNVIVGLIHANLLSGISYGYWVRKHNQHHAHPNHIDFDPDIDIPVIAFSPEHVMDKQGIARFMVKYQAVLFLPLLFLQATSMHLYALYILATDPPRYRWLELSLIAAHWGLYLGLPLMFLGPWPTLIIVVLRQGLSGFYLASVFAPNHKGMLMVDQTTELDFLRIQVLTSRNITAHPVTDFWYGGLNYQIEHHLFPTVPRNNLRQLQAIIKDFCAEHSISYYETSMINSYREILHYLHTISAPLRMPAVSIPGTAQHDVQKT